ncbi:hypothetical protein JR532_002894, partial [Listeria monocytogenes serotype 1/2a]|nr:hypothetical protein [Listeria monocytogenes serotype 1/2a]
FRNIDERIDIIIPLITFADIPTILELSIKKAMENGKKVTLYLCGGEYINKNQREILNSIIELLKKSKNGEVLSLREYFPQSIITDSNSGVLYLPSIVPLKNSGIISRVVQYTTNTMSLDVLSYFKKNVKINAIQKFDESWTKSELKKITEDIYSLLEEVDELLSDIRLGWSKEKNLSEIQRNLESFSITSKEEQFLKFIKNIYIDFVESFKKVSKKSKGKQYFDEKFHNDFPELSDALNRIRVYRNQNSHDWLDPKIKKMYFEFIIKDFEGYCPLALDNMYIIMQKRILIETLKALETTYEKLRSFKRPF